MTGGGSSTLEAFTIGRSYVKLSAAEVMMKRSLRFSIVLTAAVAVVPFLPLYIERTMMRSMVVGHAGDVITWDWKIRTLSDFWSNYRYLGRGQNPAMWLGVNLALAFSYALVIALIVDRVLARRKVARDTERKEYKL